MCINWNQFIWVQLTAFYAFQLQFPFCYASVRVKISWVYKGVNLARLHDLHYEHELTNTEAVALDNWNVKIRLRCIADYPTEWFLNYEISNTADEAERLTTEWTTRELTTAGAEYAAVIELRYKKLLAEDRLICRSVDHHDDSLLIKLTPIANPTNNGNILISSNNDTLSDPDHKGTPDSNSCKVKFEVATAGSYYYWWCNLPSELPPNWGSISHHECDNSASCANKFRNSKISPSCVTTGHSWPSSAIQDGQVASRMFPSPSGIVVCVASVQDEAGVYKTVTGAVEYFSVASPRLKDEDLENNRTIHFSVEEIRREDLILMDPVPNSIYYTQDTLHMSCDFPWYGFSLLPKVVVTLNGSRLVEGLDHTSVLRIHMLTLNFTNYGPGTYEIQCNAPIWNTTGWTNKTAKFTVRNATAPYFFKNEDVVVKYTEGDMNQWLTCDALGDPMPEQVTWAWENDTFPGTPRSTNALVLPRISSVYHDTVINCTATNRLGQSASRSFKVHVNTPVSKTTIFVTIGVLLLGILLAAGVAAVYMKFWRADGVVIFLTDEEVEAFRNGRPPTSSPIPRDGDEEDQEPVSQAVEGYTPVIPMSQLPLPIESLPYNSQYEMGKDLLLIDFKNILGRGEYGIVYKGYLKLTSNDRNPMAVAVKTVPKKADIEYFKALMSEVKILAHIGPHRNIVGLDGVNSSNIKKRELYVGVELCKTSLLAFLQDNRSSFTSHRPEPGLERESDNQEEGLIKKMVLTVLHLLQWACEIASGMEFLSEKRVVHGDLAARNVLLSFDLHAKVGDFGLGRQMVNYVYVKSTDCPLPWKWMAIESLDLDKREFSTKSDVWAFGVTLWELFSLGSEPGPAMPWSIDFVDELKNGWRLSKPAHASLEIFDQMKKCWAADPEQRPTFSDLKTFFESQRNL